MNLTKGIYLPVGWNFIFTILNREFGRKFDVVEIVSRNPWQVQAIPFGSRFSPDLLKKQTASPNLLLRYSILKICWIVLYRCWWVSSLDDRSNTSNAKHLSTSFKYCIWIFTYWKLEFKLIKSVIQYWKILAYY